MPAFGEVLRSEGGGLKALMFPRLVTGVPHGQLPSRMAAPHWEVAQGLMLSRWTESAIHRAILQGQSDILSQLLVGGENCNLRHPSGWSPLQLALHCGNQEALRILIAHGADPRERGPGGETALGLALALDSTPVELEMLLKAGANPNLLGPGGRPAISALLQVRDLERAEVILRHGGVAGPALYNAIVEGDRELLRFLLLHRVKPDGGSTDSLLVAAVRGGRRGLLEDILEAGYLSDKELKPLGREGQGPLHLAVAMNRIDLCRALVRKGADVNEAFVCPVTPAFLAWVRPVGFLKSHLKYDSGVTALMAAADSGNLEMAKLLVDHGATRSVRSSGKSFSAIGFAARRGDVKMMQLLLGVDPEHEERWIKVDLSEQRAWVYGIEGQMLLTTRVSTGKKGFRTEPGEFVITDRHRDHESNIYQGVRMPFF
tara:strand:- start:27 stop:1316 length:1290 start_codon:yes stop_codon:yes gene_type:complete